MHRRVEPRDVGPIARRVEDLATNRQAAAAKPWFRLIEPQVVLTKLLSSPLVWIVNETYLVSVEIGSPWYTSKRLVEEQLVMKLYPDGPGTFADVAGFLKSLPDWVEAEGTGVGTALATNDPALIGKYEAHGFVPVSTTLFYTGPTKENTDGRPLRSEEGG